jgi:outer membrane lipoprotein-sorting protein
MKQLLAFLIVLILILPGGCASVPTANLAGKSITPDIVQRSVNANRERVQSINGSGTISVESLEMAQSGSFEMMLRKPDSVLVNIQGPFGIHVGSALLTRTGFTFYNSLQNQLITGTVNAVNLNRIFRVNLSFDELLSLFTGGSFLEGDNRTPDSLVIQDNQFVMTYEAPEGTRRYWIDPSTLLIAKIQHTDPKGKLVLEERFERIRAVGNASLPRQIRLTQHQAHRVVAVAFSSLEINADAAPLVLDIPTNAEHVRWQ